MRCFLHTWLACTVLPAEPEVSTVSMNTAYAGYFTCEVDCHLQALGLAARTS